MSWLERAVMIASSSTSRASVPVGTTAVARLSDDQVRALEKHVRQGNALLVFPGNQVAADWYNRRLWANGTGDGLLAEFASAVDAVECAAEIQRAMPDLEKEVTAERKIQFRIGINVGDIVVAEDGDIYGEGVNVAARIESLADRGGVFISGSAFSQVRGKVELGFEDMGPHAVKNIDEPVHVYRVLLDPEEAGSVPGQMKKSGLKRQLLRRRVPHFIGLYLVSSWAFLEFTDWAVRQFTLSPVVGTFVLSLLLFLLPSVVWLAWHHGARGPDGWKRADAIFMVTNLAVAAGILFRPGGIEIGELLTRDPEGRAARQTRASALESLEDTEDPRHNAVL